MTSATSTPVVPRSISRSRRKRAIRARTFSMKRLTKRELEVGRVMYPEARDVVRPTTRGDCAGGERPCPFVRCRHHLYLDVTEGGAVKLNFPDLEPWEMAESCSLDVADRGLVTLERVGELMNIVRERVRQIEVAAFDSLRPRCLPIVAESRDDDPMREQPAGPAVHEEPDAFFAESLMDLVVESP